MQETQKLSNVFLYAALAGGRSVGKSTWQTYAKANAVYIRGTEAEV